MKKSIQDLKESLRKKEEKQQRLREKEESIEKDITYRCFCRWLCTRYEFESRYRDRHKLSPCTVLGYFKRERGG